MKNFLIVSFCVLCSVSFAQTYNIMTYNIRYDNPNDGVNTWSKRKVYLGNQILYNQLDVLGIQEGLHHQVVYIDSVLTQFNYVGAGRDDAKEKGEYSAIFYNKKRLGILKEGTFWLSETPDKISVGWDASMKRICTYSLFENTLNKEQFWVFNTHFDHIGKKARLESAKLIYEKIKEFNQTNLPVILMGDLNLKPESEAIKYLSSVMNDSKSISLLKPFGTEGTFNGFKFNQPVKDRIDYIFTSKDRIQVNKFAILSDSKDCKYPSDHLPVVVEVEFTLKTDKF
jgi:endonuclease/exonuclease/phosphatase family metal-dependent hydrolase|tara:strand:- start:2057 stop:2908 length:852 start_codon:yes stop_codon:yes gene_type:complete